MGPSLSSLFHGSSFHLLMALSKCHALHSQVSFVVPGSSHRGLISDLRRISCVHIFVSLPHLSEHPLYSLSLQALCYTARRALIYLLTYGAEPFLTSCQFCSHSRTSQHFMELESSLPCSQELSTGPCPEPGRSSPYHPIPPYLSKIHFNIVYPSTSWSS
jgi:hypothetical protein